jgi:hypothetical protein
MPPLFEGVHRCILHSLRLLIARSPVLSRGFQEQINEFPLIKKLTEKNNLIITYKFRMNITRDRSFFQSRKKHFVFSKAIKGVAAIWGDCGVAFDG